MTKATFFKALEETGLGEVMWRGRRSMNKCSVPETYSPDAQLIGAEYAEG